MKKKKKRSKFKENLPGILLIVSVLLLGILIIILVDQSKTHIELSGDEEVNRTISGNFPTPEELIQSDKTTYFSSIPIPDMIFQKMQGVSFLEDTPVSRDELRYMKVLYYGIDGESHQGELIVNVAIVEDVQNIFYNLYKAKYPIESIQLIDDYNGNDEISMANNNTSCFNTRKIMGTDTWSKHAYGMAIDINPLYNPYVGEDGQVLPVEASSGKYNYADRDTSFPMKIDETDYAFQQFTNYGFTWGGFFETVKDYQHFEK